MLVTTNLYLLLTFASEIQRRVDSMYSNSDYGNILMILHLSSLRYAHAGSRIINHQVKGLASLDACKRVICLILDISGYSYFILIVSYLFHMVYTIITTSKPRTTEQTTP